MTIPLYTQEQRIAELERELAEARKVSLQFAADAAHERDGWDAERRAHEETRAGAAKMREALQWFRDRSHCNISPTETEQIVDAALAAVADARRPR